MPLRKGKRGRQEPGTAATAKTTAGSDYDTTIFTFGRLPPGATGSTGAADGQSVVARLEHAIRSAEGDSEADRAVGARLLSLAHPSHLPDGPLRFEKSDMAGLHSSLHSMSLHDRQALLSDYLTWQQQQTSAERAFTHLQQKLSEAVSFPMDPEYGRVIYADRDPTIGRGRQRHIFHLSSQPCSPETMFDFIKSTQESDAETGNVGGTYISARHHYLPPRSPADDRKSDAYRMWKNDPHSTTHLSREGARSVQWAVDEFTDKCDTRSAIAKVGPAFGFWAPGPTAIASNVASWLSSTAKSLFTRAGKSGTGTDALPSINWTKYRMDLINSWRSDWGHSLQDPESWASVYDHVVASVYKTLFGEDANERRKARNVQQEVFDANTGETRLRTKKDKKNAGVVPTTFTRVFDPHKTSIAHDVRDEIKAALVAAVKGGLNAEDERSKRVKLGERVAKAAKEAKEPTEAERST